VTSDEIYLLQKLNYKQLLAEITYLCLTVAPNIKQRSKSGRFTEEQLRNQIVNVIKPTAALENNLNTLINTLFSETILEASTSTAESTNSPSVLSKEVPSSSRDKRSKPSKGKQGY
jgi:hypothetical protein